MGDGNRSWNFLQSYHPLKEGEGKEEWDWGGKRRGRGKKK